MLFFSLAQLLENLYITVNYHLIKMSVIMKILKIKARLEKLKLQIVSRYNPEKIILFGSAARDDVEVNDIDLFIIKEDTPDLGSERIRQLYRLVDTDLPVDYIVYRPKEVTERLTLGDPFIVNIFNEGKVLYG